MADKCNEKGLTRLGISVMLVAVLAVSALVGYVAFDDDGDIVTVFAGLENDTLQVRGAVMAESSTGLSVGQVSFVLALADGAEPVDFRMASDLDTNGLLSDEASATHTVLVSYTDASQQVSDLTWKVEQYGPAVDGDNVLEAGENFRITIGADESGNSGLLCNALTPELGPNTAFSIDLKTPDGQVLTVERTTPVSLIPVMILE